MTTGEFIQYTSKLTGVPMKRLRESLYAIQEGLIAALKDGETVHIHKMGDFYLYKRDKPMVTNNFGRGNVTIEPNKRPKFKASMYFMRLFNE